MRTLIRGGRLVLPEGLRDGELLLEDGRIEGIGAAGELRAERVLDAAGCYVLPGLVDLHVHLDDRIGGCFLADTYESGSRVALQNGVTTLCSFITHGPGEGLRTALRMKDAGLDLVRAGRLSPLAALAGDGVEDPAGLRAVLEKARAIELAKTAALED